MRLSILLTVDSLTRTPVTRPRYSPLSSSVAAGRVSRSAFKSSIASSLIFDGEPGLFFGARGPALAGQPGVALNRGEADPEQAGHLALAYAALFDCFDYLPA